VASWSLGLALVLAIPWPLATISSWGCGNNLVRGTFTTLPVLLWSLVRVVLVISIGLHRRYAGRLIRLATKCRNAPIRIPPR